MGSGAQWGRRICFGVFRSYPLRISDGQSPTEPALARLAVRRTNERSTEAGQS